MATWDNKTKRRRSARTISPEERRHRDDLKAAIKRIKSVYEHLPDYLNDQCTRMGLPKAEREFKFHPTRKWRADLAWPKAGLIVEVDGGVWSGGRHTRPGGYIKDCEKLNAATLLGWRIMRFTTDDLGAGTATPMIVEYFKRRRLIK